MHPPARRSPGVSLLLLALLAPALASAVDLRLSAFGTIGYARSDRDFTYLRYIDDRGTFKTDSLLGLQAEAQFSPQWGATVQGVASAPRTRDDGTEAKIRWAFLSWRPDNDWLLRFGRARPPIFFHTQNAEVGVTYDQARLPAEVYSLSPVYDFDGASVTRTWATSEAETTLDGYWGKADVKYRFHSEAAPPQPYFPERITVGGLIVSHSSGTVLLRAGAHHAKARSKAADPFADTFVATAVPFPPPLGGTLFVPTGLTREFEIYVLTVGADWRYGDWRLTSEYAQRIVPDLDIAFASKSAYATLSRRLGNWSPYVTYARLISEPEVRNVYKAISGAPVPLAVQGPPFFVPANAHAAHADRISIYDQYSTAVGASYGFSATSKLKLEWMRTKIGLASSLTDGDARGKSVHVISMSYNFAF